MELLGLVGGLWIPPPFMGCRYWFVNVEAIGHRHTPV
jgi:hypothetical protein